MNTTKYIILKKKKIIYNDHIFLSKTVYQSFLISSLIGISLLIYDYNKRFKNKNQILVELTKIFGLILLTFVINTLFYKFYNKKL